MSPAGAKKAAMLLMSLEPAAAAELLKEAPPEQVVQIAAEMMCLDQAGAVECGDPVREFFGILAGYEATPDGKKYAEQILRLVLGDERSQQVLGEVNELAKARDPFREVRDADASLIAQALEGESPQAVAVVLSELPAKKSTELLGLLAEDARVQAVRCISSGQEVLPEAKLRVVAFLQDRLGQAAAAAAETPEAPAGAQKQQRKAAVLLRGLDVEPREALLKALAEQDAEGAEAVKNLMILWEDISLLADRALQEAMRSFDSRKLALALVDADDRTVTKIRNNISERAKAMLDEEASLLSAPKPAEVNEARDEILQELRQLNESGELQFEED